MPLSADNNTNNKELPKEPPISQLFRYGLVTFVIFSLLLAATLFYSTQDQLIDLTSADPVWLLLALAVQTLSQLTVVFAWHQNMKMHRIHGVSIAESAVLVGISSVGKYAPGKVLGAVLRGFSIYRKRANGDAVILASFLDQLAMLHSGVALLAIFLTHQYLGFEMAGACTVLVLVSFYFIKYLRPVLMWFADRFNRPIPLLQDSEELDDLKRYAVVFSFLGLNWLIASWAFQFCVLAVLPELEMSFAEAVMITMAAYLGGFLALFTPVGIGVREGIMVSLLLPFSPIGPALAIATLHRLVTMVLDLSLGLYALLFRHLVLETDAKENSQ